MKSTTHSLLIFTVFALCFCTFAFGQRQPINQEKVDSILQVVGTMEKDMSAIKILTSNSGQNRYTKPTKKLIDNAIAISKERDDAEMLANSYYSLGNYYFFNAQLDSASIYLNKSLTYLPEDKFPFVRSGILATKGGIASHKDAVSQSIVYTMQAREILDKIDTTALTEALEEVGLGYEVDEGEGCETRSLYILNLYIFI